MGTLLSATTAPAAERIQITFGPLQRSIPVSALEAYVRDGTINADLAPYAHYIPEEQRQPLRQLLQTRVNLSPVVISQFFYTPQGETLLRRLGDVIRTESNLSGFHAIRSALILAAASPQGLTPLTALEQFPLPTVRIDLERVLKIVGELEDTVTQTQTAIASIEKIGALEAAYQQVPPSGRLPDVRQRGNFRFDRISLTLADRQRDRRFSADLYLPRINPRSTDPAPPLVVISHGLGSNRSSFQYLANQLASYGFAVAVPEHPGSNTAQLQALLAGQTREVAEPQEFIDRPLDIRFMLDELTRMAQNDPQLRRRVNPNQVGVIGQSLGAYTALALAGAPINRERLTQDCVQEDSLNLSLLLQCRAVELPTELPELGDRRIKAILPINPLGSLLFGSESYAALTVPILMVAGGADTVTPVLAEQLRPFSWLSTPNRYLLLMTNGTHFSSIDVPAHEKVAVDLPPELVGPDPEIAHRYLNAMAIAFFQVYLSNQSRFRPLLSAAYVEALSQPAMPLSLVRSLPEPVVETLTARP